ncbi:metal-dependent hydrolase [Candidatus Gracilibacteria bacterium]|nr:metal-dependent hydrolase [Candidatus Gracilibacteria bacterium]
MDTGTHVVTGLVLSTLFENLWAKLACFIGAIWADWMLVSQFLGMSIKEIVSKYKNKGFKIPAKITMKIYYFCHSLLVLTLVFVSAWFFRSEILFAFAIGHASHIVWDIPTHTGVWSYRPFYPFLDVKIKGYRDWWLHREMLVFILITWIWLLALYLFLR